MAGAAMGSGPGKGGIYDPRQKKHANTGKTGYWASVQSDLNKRSKLKSGSKLKTKKVGR